MRNTGWFLGLYRELDELYDPETSYDEFLDRISVLAEDHIETAYLAGLTKEQTIHFMGCLARRVESFYDEIVEEIETAKSLCENLDSP